MLYKQSKTHKTKNMRRQIQSKLMIQWHLSIPVELNAWDNKYDLHEGECEKLVHMLASSHDDYDDQVSFL